MLVFSWDGSYIRGLRLRLIVLFSCVIFYIVFTFPNWLRVNGDSHCDQYNSIQIIFILFSSTNRIHDLKYIEAKINHKQAVNMMTNTYFKHIHLNKLNKMTIVRYNNLVFNSQLQYAFV